MFGPAPHFVSLAVSLLLFSTVLGQGGAPHPSETAIPDAKHFQLAPGLKLDVWAAEPQLSNSVAFAFDGKGRVYLAESDRWAISVFDITQHTNWLWQDMSFRSVAERGAFLTNQFATNLAFLTKDSEVVRRVEDRDGDGQADHTEIVATGFTNAVDGTAAGVLATREGIYFANIPSLWRIPNAESRMTNGSASGSSTRNSKLETRNSLATGFGVHIGVSGHDLHGLIKGPDGRIYMSFGDRGCVLTNREGIVINLPDTGGVLRCEPDGRDLEVFCYGLRNPQKLAFDDFGNLWTVDNDTAGADPCRVLHLVEGGDYGWRTSYQHMDGFGPWVQEELWKGGQDGILPPAGTVSQGPSGLAFYPGTGFGARLAGTFLHADFPGGVWAYTVKPQGASYVVDRKEKFLWNCWPTDVDFGPDGAAYVLDWVSGWGQTPRGRIYRITPAELPAPLSLTTGFSPVNLAPRDTSAVSTASSPGVKAVETAASRPVPDTGLKPGANENLALVWRKEAALVAQVKQLLAEGMTQRGEKELLDLLGHADRRVRLEAQWELAGRGRNSFKGLISVAKRGKNQLARIHALWAIGQIARQLESPEVTHALKSLVGLCSDDDQTIKEQALLTLSDARLFHVATACLDALKDKSPSVRAAGLLSLSHLASNGAWRHEIGMTSKAVMAGADVLQSVVGEYDLRASTARSTGRSEGFYTLLEGELGQRLAQVELSDPFIIHFATLALQNAGKFFPTQQSYLVEADLETAASSTSATLRLLVLNARRRIASPVASSRSNDRSQATSVVNFLTDSDPRLIVAAGRAIHDVPIVEGFPALAAFITKIDCPTNLMSRVINACYRLGTQQHAQMLAGFAAREDVPDWARVLALRALADWEKLSPLDRVNGLWRPLVTEAAGRSRREEAQTSPTRNQAVAPEKDQSLITSAPTNPLLERAAQAQAARSLGRAAEIPVLPADLGRSVPYDEAMALRRNPAPAQRAFLRVAGDLMNPFNLNEAGQPAGTREVLPLQIAVAEAAAKLRVKEAGTPLFGKFARTNTAPELRRAILPALAELRSPLTGEAVKLALADPDPKLRATALPYLDRLEGDSVDLLVSLIGRPPSPRPSPPGRGGNAPATDNPSNKTPLAPTTTSPVNAAQSSATATVEAAARLPASPSPEGEGRGEGGRPSNIPLAQAALAALANLPDLKAKAALRRIVTDDANNLPRELVLDVIEAARVRGISAIKPEPADLLVGGNAERGRQVFFQNQTVQCLRCHKIGTDGGIVGPDLSGIGKRQSRDYLLESILQPNAKIAAGFENVVLTLADGSTIAGSLKAEGDGELTVDVPADDGTLTPTKVVKSKISQRARGPSAMPEGLADPLTPFELRDLVEYLATLK